MEHPLTKKTNIASCGKKEKKKTSSISQKGS